jgi:hypothetical protein
MDPVTLSAAVVAALTPYLAKAGEKFAEAAGGAAFKGLSTLYDAVKQRVHGTPAAESLADLERSPQDPDNQADLRKSLRRLLEADPELLKQLSGLLPAAEAGGSSFSTSVAGDVKNLVEGHTLHIGSIS